MPSWCSVPRCSSGRSGHRFPRDESMKKKWLKAIRRETFYPSKEAIVCKNHFTSEDYRHSLPGYVEYPSTTNFYLKKSAVPNVFSWNDLKKKGRNNNNKEIEENKTDANQENEKLSKGEIGCKIKLISNDKAIQCNIGDPCGCNMLKQEQPIT